MDEALKISESKERGRRAGVLPRIILHEWRILAREKTLWIVAALLSLLMIYAAFNGATWINFQKQTIADALAEESERLLSMQAELRLIDAGQAKAKLFRDPARPGWVGEFLGERYAVLAPQPLAALSIGQRDLYPYYFRVSTQSADTFIGEDEIENPFNLLTGRFDQSFVIIFLLPLVILAVSFNLLSFEKESGTLALALAQPVGISSIIWGKITARFVFVVGLTILLVIVGAFLSGASFFDGETILRLFLLSLAIAIYAAFWFALAAAVNLRPAATSAGNAALLAGAWLFFVVIIPSLLTIAASRIYLVPSRLAYINAAREERNRTSTDTANILEDYYAANPDLRPAEIVKTDFMSGFYAAQFERDKRLLPLLRSYDERLAAQNRLAENLRFLSPSLAMQSILNDLAATGFERYHRFTAQVHEYHREWQQFFLPRLFKNQRLTPDDYDRFPTWDFTEESFSAIIGRVAFGFGVILFLTLAPMFYAARRLRRFSTAE